MFESIQTIKSLVIQGHLNGKTRDQIASEAGISAGKTSEIIWEWSGEIGTSNATALRDFAVTVRKEGMSVRQCAEGYRMIRLLKKFGVRGGADDGYDGGNNFDPNMEIMSFLEDTYLNCKNLGIPPSAVQEWIKDLVDFYHHCIANNKNGFSLDSHDSSNSNSAKKGFVHDNPTGKDEGYWEQKQQDHGPEQQSNGIRNTKPNKQNAIPGSSIPFVSQFSRCIAQMKKEIGMLKADKQATISEIDSLQIKLDKAEDRIRQTVKGKKGSWPIFGGTMS
jgi:hypothetical protein